MKDFDVNKFRLDLDKFEWDEVFNSNDVNDQLALLEKKVVSLLDSYCPTKRKMIKGNSTEWMTPELLENIRSRNFLKNKLDDNPTVESKKEYNRMRNFVKLKVSRTKRNYFLSNFEKIHDSGHIWKTYFKLTGRYIKQSLDIPFLKVDDNLKPDDEEKSLALY